MTAPPQYALQTTEKTYVTFEVTARNRGGHSSLPRPDNAIYDLADALKRIAAHRFPVRWNEATLADLAGTAAANDDEVGRAAARFVSHPGDPDALAVLQREPWIDSTLRTTCVATRLRPGDADNALATHATATVNCRVFPGETIAQTQAALQATIGAPAIEVKLLNAQGDSPVLATPAAPVQALERVLAVRAPGLQVIPFMAAGATDSLHFRRAGIPTVGMGRLLASEDTSYRYHGINENVPVTEFVGGLEHYYRFIKALDAVERPVDAAAR